MSPFRLVLLSLGFTLVHIATSPERDVQYNVLHQEMISLKEASFIIVYITQALAAPVVTLTMRYYCCTQNSALIVGVLLSTSSFITESFHFMPGIHIFLAICMGVARALVDTSVLHIIAGKNPALPGTTGFSIWSATLGFSYAVAGMIMFFISDSDSISQATDSVNNANSTALTGDPNLAFSFAEMVTPMVIYIIGGGFLVGASVKGKCDLKQQLIENDPHKGSVRLNRRAYCAVAVMILFYGFIGSNLFQLFAVCSDSIGFQAQSLTCFGVAFTLMSLYVTYRGKSELDTSAILSTLLVIGFILTGILFPVDCIAGEDFYMMGSSMMLIPMAGMFLGGGCGLLTCEVLSLVSMGWPTHFKYAALVSSQGLWAAASPFVPIDGWPRNFLVIMSVLAVVYYFTAFYIHAVLKRFKKVKDRERLTYGAVDQKPEEIQNLPIPSSSATSDVVPV